MKIYTLVIAALTMMISSIAFGGNGSVGQEVSATQITNQYIPQPIQQGRFQCDHGLMIIVQNGRDNIYRTSKTVLGSLIAPGQIEVSIWNPHYNQYVSFGCTQE